MWILNPKIFCLLLLLKLFPVQGQIAWTWTPLADMPLKTSNNAVSQGEMTGNPYVYSFGGIDTSKVWSGVHKRAFRYNVTNNVWDEIDTLPVVLPLIASSASTVKNKIYIIGGYHVYSDGNETSSNEVIIYDPETNSYLPNGTPIPVPIDDQTQCVWNDSLIYVITGWSNTTNVPDVQIYNPELDQWQAGTNVTNTSYFKAFGSSGYIIGDTIFYYGGATTGFNFPAQAFLRKGVINPADPTQITWTQEGNGPHENYRSACLSFGNTIFWVGGSSTSYNYNGVAYNGSGGVEPLTNIARYDVQHGDWYEGTGAPNGVMDLRGNGQISSAEWIICGGMETGQQVSDKTYLLTYDPITGSTQQNQSKIPVYSIQNGKIIFETAVEKARLIGMDGKLVDPLQELRIRNDLHGVFILEFRFEGTIYRDRIYVK